MHKVGAWSFICVGLLGLALLLPRPAAAAWPTDPLVNVPLCTATGNKDYPTAASDGAGGAIVTWMDSRGDGRDIYAQHVLASGTVDPAWPVDGRALSTAVNLQELPVIAPDGAGGAIVAWHDYRSGMAHLYAQRVLASGAVDPAWPADGRALCAPAYDEKNPAIVADGGAPGVAGSGAIVAWMDGRSGTNSDIYAQHVFGDGAVDAAWPSNGRALCTAAGNQYSPMIVADGAGGAIVTWYDYRNGSENPDIFAQHVLAGGAVDPAWPADGRALCTAANYQQHPTLVADGSGGAIVTWFDYRSGTNHDIYAQHVLAGGAVDPAWPAAGRALCTAAGDQAFPSITADGSGGALVTWMDGRSGVNDIYAQHVLAGGAVDPAWPADGRALCTAPGSQYSPAIVADGAGGGVVTWWDMRGGSGDIYAQHVQASGAVDPAWPADGRALSTAAGNQEYPAIVGVGAGGVIVAWMDQRSGTRFDVYAQYVQPDGRLGGDVASVPGEAPASVAFALDPVRPNPTHGGTLTVRFALPGGAAASLELLDVAGRRIAKHEVGALGAGRHTLDLGEGARLAPGLYLVCLRQGTNTRVTRVAVLK